MVAIAARPAETLWDRFAAAAAARPDAVALIAGARRVTYRALAALAVPSAGGYVAIEHGRSVELVAALLGAWRAGATVVPIDPAWPAERRARIAAELAIAPHDPAVALALYTSGSTGEPKAVRLDHAALAWRLDALAAAMPYRADDVAVHRTPPTFVDAYAEILGPLFAGVPAVIVGDLRDLPAALDGVTRMLIVPSLLAHLVDALPASLRLIACSGEPLTAALAARVAAASDARLVNIYGSTEVAGDATWTTIAPGEPISIGRPLAGAALRIVDGELWVGGPGLARDYLLRPALTAERFVTDATGARWFKTGDRATRLPDGRYALAGRIDDQVKIHGVRVELGEIEAALRGDPHVVDALAAAHDGTLHAVVTGNPDLAALRARLTVGCAIAIVDAIPTNAHGKRDRSQVARRAPVARPADPRVAMLAGWFAELAGAPCGADDDLVAIGGDSLARLGLLVKLEGAGWHLEHADLPQPLTPARLAAVLGEPRDAAGCAPDDGAPFPVTDYQRVMVLDSLANRGAPLWLDQLAYALPSGIDAGRFEAAWRDELAAQPALRTTFVVDDRVQQRVHPSLPLRFAHLDLAGLALDAYRQRVKAEEWTRISLAFSLERGPLFAVCLATGRDRCDVIFTYHHAILDGESARCVLRAVLARYAGEPVAPSASFRAFCERPVAPVAPLAASLAGHVVAPPRPAPRATGMGDVMWRLFHRLLAIRGWLAARRVRRRAKRLPLSHAPAVYAGGDVASQPLPRALDAAVAAFAARHTATPVAVWATAFALHLARERATRDVVFGVVVSGRDGTNTVGMLANCLPLRIALAPGAAGDTCARVAASLAQLEAHGRAPLLEVAAAAGLDPRVFLDTLLTVWRFPTAACAVPVAHGRGLTMTAPHTALIVSQAELAVGASAFHRTDRVRRDVLALLDAMLGGASIDALLALRADEGGLSIAQPAL